MRAFFALALPAEVRAELAALRTDVGKARWVAPAQLHVTLRFLGEIDEPTERRLIDEVESRRAPWPTLRLVVRGVGVFGAPRKPRVLWAALDPVEPLRRIAEDLEQAVRAVGLPPEDRPFTAHVTLARLTRPDPARVAELVRARATFATQPFDARALTLYSSTLTATGAVHEPRHTFPLGQPPGMG